MLSVKSSHKQVSLWCDKHWLSLLSYKKGVGQGGPSSFGCVVSAMSVLLSYPLTSKKANDVIRFVNNVVSLFAWLKPWCLENFLKRGDWTKKGGNLEIFYLTIIIMFI